MTLIGAQAPWPWWEGAGGRLAASALGAEKEQRSERS